MKTKREEVGTSLMFREVLGYGLYMMLAYQFLHLVSFVGNLSCRYPSLQKLFPGCIDYKSESVGSFEQALLIDLMLVCAFVVQHSLMARLGFQQWMRSWAPIWLERFSYLLMTSVCCRLFYHYWQPLTHTVWKFHGMLAMVSNFVFFVGFCWMILSIINTAIYDLFELRQAFTGRAAPQVSMMNPIVYCFGRHPIFFGALICFWATPEMTQGRMMFALLFTIYTLVASRWQDRDMSIKKAVKCERESLNPQSAHEKASERSPKSMASHFE